VTDATTTRAVSPPWRFAVFVLATAVGVLGLRLVQGVVSGFIPVALRPASFMVVIAGGLLIGHEWTFRLVEPRSWRWVGLGREALQGRMLVTGALLGAGAILVPSLVLISLGWLRFESAEPGSILSSATMALVVLIPASLWEELFVRGFAFAILRERWGTTAALLATSLTFGGLHLTNVGATPQSVAVVTLAGIFLGLVLVRTGSLYAAWAAHLAWNVVLVIGLHAAVSGIEMSAPSYRLVDAGPDWATGGAWGPEGGLLAAAGLVVATLIIYRRPRGRLEPAHE